MSGTSISLPRHNTEADTKTSKVYVVEAPQRHPVTHEDALSLGIFAGLKNEGLVGHLLQKLSETVPVMPLHKTGAIILTQREVLGAQTIANHKGYAFAGKYGDAIHQKIQQYRSPTGGSFMLGNIVVAPNPTDRDEHSLMVGYKLRAKNHAESPAETLRINTARPLREMMSRLHDRSEDTASLRDPRLLLPLAIVQNPTDILAQREALQGHRVLNQPVELGSLVVTQQVGFPDFEAIQP